jgi:alpha-tubulin suppressor-like RCC1 family protein
MASSANLATIMANLHGLGSNLQVSNLSIGRSNTGYALDVLGPTALTGALSAQCLNNVVSQCAIVDGLGDNDTGVSVASDTAGNIYMTGTYISSATASLNNLNGTASSYTLPATSGVHTGAYTIKYNSSGVITGLSTFDSAFNDIPAFVNTDASNNVYVSGLYNSTSSATIKNFDGTTSAFSIPASSSQAAFLVKYNSAGMVTNAITLDSSGSDNGSCVFADSSNNLYFVGWTRSSGALTLKNLNGTNSAKTISYTGDNGNIPFVVKYNSSGAVVGGFTLNGVASVGTGARAGCVDASGNIYVVGSYCAGAGNAVATYNMDGTASSPAITLPATAVQSGLLLKFNASGSLIAASHFNPANGAESLCITTDASGNIYIAGSYKSTTATVAINNIAATTTASAFSLPMTTGSNNMGYIIKYNSAGTVVGYVALNYSGVGSSSINAITMDLDNNVFATGSITASSNSTILNMDGSSSSYQISTITSGALMLKINSAGAISGYSSFTGTVIGNGCGVCRDPSGHVYMSGQYNSASSVVVANLDGSSDAKTLPSTTGSAGYIMKIPARMTANLSVTGLGIGKSNAAYALDVVGDVNVTGAFRVGGSNLGNLVANVRAVVSKLFVSSLTYSTAIIATNGTVYTWGYNFYGQLGTSTNNGTETANPTPTAITVAAGKTITTIVCGGNHTVALDSTGAVYTWGYNFYGQLGTSTNNGTNNANPTPTAITVAAGKTITVIACSDNHTVALDSTGAVYTWGYNIYGQLGTSTNSGTNNANPTPTAITVAAGKTIVAIACGESHVVALDSTGAVYTWGRNFYGQLGTSTNNGTNSANPAPTAITVAAGKTITAIACGGNHVVALDSTGAVYTWGRNNSGELGTSTNNGTETANPAPTAITVAAGKTITAIACGGNHTVALDSTGAVYTWGRNFYGQLGTSTNSGTNNANPTPTAITVAAGKTIVAIACGRYQTVALDSTGAVYTWGRNFYGELGTSTNSGTNNANSTPTLIQNGGLAPSTTLLGNLGIGKSNAAYSLDVLGDINFTGSMLKNGAPLASGQFTTNSGSNVYLPSGSNLGIGKSNAAYTLDVVGDINFTGTLRSNNTPLSLSLPSDITVDNVDAKTSTTLSVGANAATTILNLGTNGANQAINMGTGSGLKTITIGGGTDDTIAINGNLTVAGTTVTVNSSNANILDKVITLNKGGAAASGGLVGLEIEEAGSAAGGYLRTNATRDAWVAKAPNGSEVTIGGAYTANAPLSISGTTLSIAAATSNAVGVVRVDGTTISVSSGVISQTNPIYALTLTGAGAAAPTVSRWTGPGTVTMTRNAQGQYTATFSTLALSAANSCFVGTLYYPNLANNSYFMFLFPPAATSTSFSFGMGTPTSNFDLGSGIKCHWMICP